MPLLKRTAGILKEENGSAIILLAMAMTVLLGCMALVADVGVNYVQQQRLAVAADSAALAASAEFGRGQ